MCIQALPLVGSNQWALRARRPALSDPLIGGGAGARVPSNFRNISVFVIVKFDIDPPSHIVPDTWHGLNELREADFQGRDFSFARKAGPSLRAAFHSP